MPWFSDDRAREEDDLAGYAVYRTTSAGGPWGPVSSGLPARPYFQDAAPPTAAVYVVRAVDTSGNVSAPSAVTPVQAP